MALVKEVKTELVKGFQQHDKDTGSPEVQIAILDYVLDGTFQVAQEGPPFPARVVDTGRTSSSVVGLSPKS